LIFFQPVVVRLGLLQSPLRTGQADAEILFLNAQLKTEGSSRWTRLCTKTT